MFYKCICNNKIEENDLIPGQNCLVQPEVSQMSIAVLRRKGLDFARDYIYDENVPVFCKKCGRRMKVFLDTQDE